MAKNKFSLNFDGFLDLTREVDKLGEGLLIQATKEAIQATKDYVNAEVEKAMNTSKHSFIDGEGYSKGKAKRSLEEVASMPVQIIGTNVVAYAGVDMKEAPEVVILATGTPHIAKDTKLSNAIRVKGKIRKEVDRIQKEVFTEALRRGLNNG